MFFFSFFAVVFENEFLGSEVWLQWIVHHSFAVEIKFCESRLLREADRTNKMLKGFLFLGIRIGERPRCIQLTSCNMTWFFRNVFVIGKDSWLPFFPIIFHFLIPWSYFYFVLLLPCRRYLNKSPEDQDEDLPGLEEDTVPELDSSVLRRRTVAAAAERRMQDPSPWYKDRRQLESLTHHHPRMHQQSYFNLPPCGVQSMVITYSKL